jgi:hypothetical protein
MIVVKIIEGGGHDGYKSIATSTGKTVHAYVSTWKLIGKVIGVWIVLS